MITRRLTSGLAGGLYWLTRWRVHTKPELFCVLLAKLIDKLWPHGDNLLAG